VAHGALVLETRLSGHAGSGTASPRCKVSQHAGIAVRLARGGMWEIGDARAASVTDPVDRSGTLRWSTRYLVGFDQEVFSGLAEIVSGLRADFLSTRS